MNSVSCRGEAVLLLFATMSVALIQLDSWTFRVGFPFVAILIVLGSFENSTQAQEPVLAYPQPKVGYDLQFERLPEVVDEEVPDENNQTEKAVEPIEIIDPDAPPFIWEGSFELGTSGSSGNSDTANFRFGTDLKRTGPGQVLTLDLDYKRDSSEGTQTANRLFLDGRQEWLLDESRWSSFVHSTMEYDEFKAFDVRLTTDIGLGFEWYHTELMSLKTRFGGGVSREIKGPDDTYVPEAVFGLNWEHQLSDRSKVAFGTEYFPDVTAFEDFRINSKASWEFLIDEESNLSLKFNVADRYDSTPGGAKRNDLDYSAVLLWKF